MIPVLLLTNDDALYKHWGDLSNFGWAPARAKKITELTNWGNRGVLVIMDVKQLPAKGESFAAAVPAGLQVVVASASPNDPEGQRAMVAGAAGYIHAYMPTSGVDKVLRHVMTGKIWVGQSLMARMLSQISQARPESGQDWALDLTVRERDVARYIAQGHSNKSIADSLGITERTVRAHVAAIFEKLGVSDRLMVALCVHGLLEKNKLNT